MECCPSSCTYIVRSSFFRRFSVWLNSFGIGPSAWSSEVPYEVASHVSAVSPRSGPQAVFFACMAWLDSLPFRRARSEGRTGHPRKCVLAQVCSCRGEWSPSALHAERDWLSLRQRSVGKRLLSQPPLRSTDAASSDLNTVLSCPSVGLVQNNINLPEAMFHQPGKGTSLSLASQKECARVFAPCHHTTQLGFNSGGPYSSPHSRRSTSCSIATPACAKTRPNHREEPNLRATGGRSSGSTVLFRGSHA